MLADGRASSVIEWTYRTPHGVETCGSVARPWSSAASIVSLAHVDLGRCVVFQFVRNVNVKRLLVSPTPVVKHMRSGLRGEEKRE